MVGEEGVGITWIHSRMVEIPTLISTMYVNVIWFVSLMFGWYDCGTAQCMAIDCSQSLIFPCDRRRKSLSSMGRYLGPLMRAKWGEYKIPVGRGKGILFSPQFRSHQETKMAARSN